MQGILQHNFLQIQGTIKLWVELQIYNTQTNLTTILCKYTRKEREFFEVMIQRNMFYGKYYNTYPELS
jgi:hypothetical protein